MHVLYISAIGLSVLLYVSTRSNCGKMIPLFDLLEGLHFCYSGWSTLGAIYTHIQNLKGLHKIFLSYGKCKEISVMAAVT